MVSIIIPVYNAEKYLGRCFDSCLAQTWQDMEIIAIDDGSIDGSFGIMEKYSRSHPSVFRISKQENHGVAYTRNLGVDRAGGEYLMFIDCDDWIDEDYVETFVDCIIRHDCDMVIGGFRRVSPQVDGRQRTLYAKRIKSKARMYVNLAPWGKIYKRSFIVDNEIHFFNSSGEDIFFNVVAYNKTQNIKLLDYIGYNWFFNEASWSNSVWHYEDIIGLLAAILEHASPAEDHQFFGYFFIRMAVWYIIRIMRKSPVELSAKISDDLFSFMAENGVSLQNTYVSLFYRNGDELKTRLAINAVLMLRRLRLLNFTLRVMACIGGRGNR